MMLPTTGRMSGGLPGGEGAEAADFCAGGCAGAGLSDGAELGDGAELRDGAELCDEAESGDEADDAELTTVVDWALGESGPVLPHPVRRTSVPASTAADRRNMCHL